MNPRVIWAAELFALFAVGLASLGCSRPDPPPPPPPAPPLEVDRETLAEAMHECFTIDCDRARDLAAQISPNSPLRQTDEFHAIEYRYEVNALLRAQNETDFEKQRAMLATLRDTTDAVPEIRAAAAQLLARLGGGRRFELVLAGQPDAGSDAGTDAKAELSARIALLMKSKTPGDYEAARSLVEPRIYSGDATPDDVRTMTTICKAQKDMRCLKTLKTLKLH